MIWTRLLIALGVIVGLGVIALALTQNLNSGFVVRPESKAVVLRSGVVQRVAEAGFHFRNPLIEEVVIYDTWPERQQVVEGPFEVVGCPAEITLTYNIDDVVAFHTSGADFAALQKLVPQIPDILAKVSDDTDTPGAEAARLLWAAFADERPAGLRVIRASVDLGDCGPQPPRIEIRRDPLPAIATAGVLGAERASLATAHYLTADDARVEIEGAIVTYDVVDPAGVEVCFGRYEAIAGRVTSATKAHLRNLIGSEQVDSIAEIAGRLPETVRGTFPNCGIAVRAIDYGAATVTRLISINCDETPGAEECAAVQTIIRP